MESSDWVRSSRTWPKLSASLKPGPMASNLRYLDKLKQVIQSNLRRSWWLKDPKVSLKVQDWQLFQKEKQPKLLKEMAQSRVLDPLCAKIQIQPSLQHPSSRILGEDLRSSSHLLSKMHHKAPIREVGAPIDDLAQSRAFVCAQTAASKKFKMRGRAVFQRAIYQREEVLTISGPHLNKG